MSIRLRMTEVGWVALCAARSVPKDGDVYLDDGHHHALSVKFSLDFQSMGFMVSSHAGCEEEVIMEREESNNPNREWWDNEYGETAKESPAPSAPALPRCDMLVGLKSLLNWHEHVADDEETYIWRPYPDQHRKAAVVLRAAYNELAAKDSPASTPATALLNNSPLWGIAESEP
jgi:hypothetical protein